MKLFVKSIVKFLLIAMIPGILFILPCFFTLPYLTGDMGRFGIPLGLYDTIFHFEDYCYVKQIDNWDSLEKAEIITIGDSFSQGKEYGYQNYIGNKLGKTIYNFRLKNTPQANTAYTILEDGLAQNCKIMIVESVERLFIRSLGKEFYKFQNLKNKIIISGNNNNRLVYEIPNIKEFKKYDFNLKKLTSYYKTRFSMTNPIKKLNLSQDMFSSDKFAKSLFFYNNIFDKDGDLMFQSLTKQEINSAISNLKSLYESAKKRNIKLIYLVCADKYDLYYNWIENNPYPENKSLDYFKKFDRRQFVDTKELFIPYLNNGVKDIYRVNDTHWSIIGAQIVGEHLADIIINEKYLQ